MKGAWIVGLMMCSMHFLLSGDGAAEVVDTPNAMADVLVVLHQLNLRSLAKVKNRDAKLQNK